MRRLNPSCETLTIIRLIQLLVFGELIVKLFPDDVDADHGAERAETAAEDLPGLVRAERRLQPVQRLRVQNCRGGEVRRRSDGEGRGFMRGQVSTGADMGADTRSTWTDTESDIELNIVRSLVRQ